LGAFGDFKGGWRRRTVTSTGKKVFSMGENPKPWEGCETTEKARRALARLRETFAAEELPAGVIELAGSEGGINDLAANAARTFAEGKLDRATKLLVATAVASAMGAAEGARFFAAAARTAGCPAQAVLDAVAVATTCSTFNAYWSFRHGVDAAEFGAFRAAFHANAFLNPTLGPTIVEPICIAVSSLNGCSDCVRGHIEKARKLGLSAEQIDEAIRAGATARSLAAVASAMRDGSR